MLVDRDSSLPAAFATATVVAAAFAAAVAATAASTAVGAAVEGCTSVKLLCKPAHSFVR
jgi:hypothetical protein